MPTKFKRKGKVRWLAQVRRQGIKKSRLCATRDEALQLETNWKKEIQEQQRQILTVLEWGTKYLDYSQARFTERTYSEKRAALDDLVKVVGQDLPVEDLTTGMALQVLDKTCQSYSGYAANKARKNLIAAWNWGAKHLDGWTGNVNPFARIEPYSYQKKQKQVPDMKDVQAVLDIMPDPDRTMLLAYLHTGARRDEIFRLTWPDINFNSSKICLWTRKRKDGSWDWNLLPMTKELREALIRHRSGSDGQGYVFSRSDGRKYQYRRHWLAYWCAAAGVPVFSFHQIRHLTASWLDAHNVPLTTIQSILRHKSATTTARYLHELTGAQVDLDTIFSGAGSQGKILPIKKASGEPDTEGLI